MSLNCVNTTTYKAMQVQKVDSTFLEIKEKYVFTQRFTADVTMCVAVANIDVTACLSAHMRTCVRAGDNNTARICGALYLSIALFSAAIDSLCY